MRGLIMAAQQQARAVSPIPAGVSVWFDANQITGLADNDPVAQWNDLSGNNYHATQADAGLRPVYKTGVINGKPVLRFADDWFTLNRQTVGTTGLFCDATQEFVIIFVSKIPLNASGTIISRAVATASLRTFQVFYFGGGSRIYTPAFNIRGTETRTTLNLDDNLGHIHIITWDKASAKFIADGDSLSLNVGTAAEQVQDINIGSRTDGAGTLNGDIAEILIYDRMLSVAEITQINNYLSEKYDITLV